MAAAARLAKTGHPVELFERSVRSGRAVGSTELWPGILVDRAPSVLGFPAPWRDLFRKSGRPLEAELTRMGYALVPAEPAVYRFADGSELRLPTDRGAAVRDPDHRATAAPSPSSWRDLVDSLGGVWQALRPLGWEAELTVGIRLRRSAQLTRAVRRRLRSRRSLAEFAASAPPPASHGAGPQRRLPAGLDPGTDSRPWRRSSCRCLGRSAAGRSSRTAIDTGQDAGRSSVLVEALAARLALRQVTVRRVCPSRRSGSNRTGPPASARRTASTRRPR